VGNEIKKMSSDNAGRTIEREVREFDTDIEFRRKRESQTISRYAIYVLTTGTLYVAMIMAKEYGFDFKKGQINEILSADLTLIISTLLLASSIGLGMWACRNYFGGRVWARAVIHLSMAVFISYNIVTFLLSL